jgi:hypothetical protein
MGEGDVDAEERKAVREVGRAIHRVNQPHPFARRDAGAGALLCEDDVFREPLLDSRGDHRFHRDIRLGDEIGVMRLGAHLPLVQTPSLEFQREHAGLLCDRNRGSRAEQGMSFTNGPS